MPSIRSEARYRQASFPGAQPLAPATASMPRSRDPCSPTLRLIETTPTSDGLRVLPAVAPDCLKRRWARGSLSPPHPHTPAICPAHRLCNYHIKGCFARAFGLPFSSKSASLWAVALSLLFSDPMGNQSGWASPTYPPTSQDAGQLPRSAPLAYLPLWEINQDTDWRSRLNLFDSLSGDGSTPAPVNFPADNLYDLIDRSALGLLHSSGPPPTTQYPTTKSTQSYDLPWNVIGFPPSSLNTISGHLHSSTPHWLTGLPTSTTQHVSAFEANPAPATDGEMNMNPLLAGLHPASLASPNLGSSPSLSLPTDTFLLSPEDIQFTCLPPVSELRRKSRAQKHFIAWQNEALSEGFEIPSDMTRYRNQLQVADYLTCSSSQREDTSLQMSSCDDSSVGSQVC